MRIGSIGLVPRATVIGTLDPLKCPRCKKPLVRTQTAHGEKDWFCKEHGYFPNSYLEYSSHED